MLDKVRQYFDQNENVTSIKEYEGNIYILFKDEGKMEINGLYSFIPRERIKIQRNKVIIMNEERTMANKYEKLINEVIDLVGEKNNISYFTHCVTRLRFTVIDKDKVKVKEIEELPGAIGTSWSGNQFQVIIGNAVSDVYNSICEKHGFNTNDPIDENLDEKPKNRGIKGMALAVLDAITGSITPIIPAMVGCGMIKTILVILQFCGVDTSSISFQVLNWAGDAGYYFMPILVAKCAAKKFGANESLAMTVAGMLLYPSFIAAVGAGESINFFGIPVHATSYSSTIFPILLCIVVMAPIEKFIAKHTPETLRGFLEPMLTLLIMVPLAYCVLAPAGNVVGNWISSFVIWLYDTIGFVGVAVFCALFPVLIMFGMHTALTPYMLNQMATVGNEAIYGPSAWISNFNIGVACFVLFLKTKKENVKSTAATCSVTAIVGGITEPGLFGLVLKYRKLLYGVILGNLVGGTIAGIFGVKMYALAGSGGLFGLPAFIGPTSSNFIIYMIALVVSMIVTFIVDMIIVKPEDLEI